MFLCCTVLVYGDFGDDQHIGCFDQACDVLAIAKGRLHIIPIYTLCPYLPQMLIDSQNSFADRLSGKFATNSSLNISPHIKYVDTVPCEI